MEKKMTKMNYFEILRATYPQDVENYDEIIAFIDHEIELLKSRKTSHKMTATQKANIGLANDIFDGMEVGKMYTITEIMKEIPACHDLTNQKVTSIVTKMVDEGRIEKVVEKRRSYFCKVSE